ncbi:MULTISPECIES: HlyU family transcriptional regulator [Chelatococcus]|uniref:Transcriptional activator HlyU n=1 Tax=Chelatococcus caeni TaxID=1348468 RepID=A0A840BZC2_9HYPH|nr:MULTISPECIES: HlyU family transcriptional regulator [Chelatococcus]ALA16361.1 hypothetical protein AL346_01745 [Chelatococcus sp. CO-6]MBB4017913.1 hypothetical protein [Chelatococcus caeni]
MSFLKGLLGGLFGGGREASAEEAPAGEAVEYKGFRIRPAPYPAGGQFQTAGIIEKDIGGEIKEYRFVRAETHASRSDAENFALTKGRQIVDEQGERIFKD